MPGEPGRFIIMNQFQVEFFHWDRNRYFSCLSSVPLKSLSTGPGYELERMLVVMSGVPSL